jgi:ribosomal protein L18E
MSVAIQEIRGSTNDTTQILIAVTEKNASGQSRKIAATEVANFLNSVKAQLANISVANIAAVVAPSQEEIQAYLAMTPVGMLMKLSYTITITG